MAAARLADLLAGLSPVRRPRLRARGRLLPGRLLSGFPPRCRSLDPCEAARIDVPTLLLIGSESPADIQGKPETVAAALPDARIRTLDGQGHLAYLTDPEGFAAEVLAFLAD